MSYRETINYLYNLQKYGIKFGLDNISKLMSAFGNPQESFSSVHITGTNGKGTTSAILSSLLQTSGLKVGLFTSPHLVSFTERIRVNDEEIREDEVISLTEEIREKVSSLKSQVSDFSPTFFEIVTTIALLYFKRKKIDRGVIEVGMGGRLDGTNIILPEVTVITNISYDHMKFLGTTLREIACEKAGIIKERTPVILSSQVPEVLEVIEAKAQEKNAPLYLYGRDFSSVLKREGSTGIYFDYYSGFLEIQDVYLPLLGEYQIENASVGIKAFELLTGKVTVHSVREGLKNLRWPGRLEMIHDDPPILIDGAHNPAAAVALSNALQKNFPRKQIILILGIMADKDIEGIMKPLLPLASTILLTSPGYERAASPEKLSGIAASLGFPDAQTAPTVKDALELAESICQQSNPPLPPFTNSSLFTHHSSLIVVTGSFYTIGKAKEILGEKAILGSLREAL